MQYASGQLYGSTLSPFSILLGLYKTAQGDADRTMFCPLLWEAMRLEDGLVSNKALFEALRLLALHGGLRRDEAIELYVERVRSQMRHEEFTNEDSLVLFNNSPLCPKRNVVWQLPKRSLVAF